MYSQKVRLCDLVSTRIGLAAAFVFLTFGAQASPLLEMPDTTEVPGLKRDSMLMDMDIPGVRDRDPNPLAGPRLNIREFRVQGLIEYPKLGITREAIIKQVEAIRFELMAEDQFLDSGYTLDELSEVSDLIAEIERETEIDHVGPLEVQRLVFLIRDQRRQRGITLGMVETVADTITRYYRERGFILAKAYIPKQHVREGVVNLTLLLGELGEVEVNNNRRYSDRLIQGIFRSDTGKPVTSAKVEERLFFVNDLPGLSAQGFFQSGSQVGDTRLNINVLEERWYNANLRVDNHGSKSSGEYRVYADFYLHNPLGIGDQIHIGVLNSFEPDNSLYGSFRYNTNVYFPRLKFSAGISNNDFALAETASESIDSLGINGTSRITDVSLKYQIKRSRISNHSLGIRASEIESTVRFAAFPDSGDFGLDDTVRNTELFYEFDMLNEESRILHQGQVAVTSSDFILGAEENQEENPTIVNLDYSMLTFVKIPFTEIDTRFVFRASGQYSGVSLSSINQYALAGPTRARGFAVNEFYADDGAHAGFEWIFRAPNFGNISIAGEDLNSIFQPFFFADYSYGKAYGLLAGAEDLTANLSNIGLGLKINYSHTLRGNLLFAVPQTAKKETSGGIEYPDKDVKLYFDLQYSF